MTEQHDQLKNVPTPENTILNSLELAEIKSSIYQSFIDSLVTNNIETKSIIKEINCLTDSDTRAFFMDIVKVFVEMKAEISENKKNLTNLEILSQAISTDVLNSIDKESIELDESKTIPTFFIETTKFDLIRRYAQAFASFNSKVPFIGLRKFPEGEGRVNYKSTNLPHEIQHIFSKYLRSAEIFYTDEEDIDLQDSYLIFIDEVISRTIGGERPMGYSLFSIMKNDTKEKFMTEEPEKYKKILDITGKLNDKLEDLHVKIQQKGIDSKILIGSILQTHNYSDLEKELDDLDSLLDERKDIVQVAQSNSWGRVDL